MSTPALYLITSESTVVDACRGWKRALDQPVRITKTNPFTDEPFESVSYVPDGVSEEMDCVGLDEALNVLREAEPLAVDVTVPPGWHRILNETVPFLYGYDEKYEGWQSVIMVPLESEQEVIDCFSNDIGELRSEAYRRENQLRVFILWYSG